MKAIDVNTIMNPLDLIDINSKQIIYLNVKPETMELLEKKIGKNTGNSGEAKIF